MRDEEIIGLYFDRDEQAIAQTDAAYGKYCRAIARNILRNEEDALESVNDAYLDTWNAIPPTRPFSLKAFVGRLTRNRALNRYEYNTAARRGGTETALCLEELGECVSGKETPEGRAEYEHLITCINHFLSSLKKEQRILFLRRYWYDCTIREIAQDLGISESRVKVTLLRLRGRLREYLEKEGVHV